MAVLGTKEGAKKPWKRGQMGISVRRHEDSWYEDLAELAFEAGLKTLAAVGGFAVGGPAGAMAAASAAGYVNKSLTGEETIPADITGSLAYLVSSGYEKMQEAGGDEHWSTKQQTPEEKAAAKHAGAPDVPADITKGNYVYKDGKWVEAGAGSQAANVSMAVPPPPEPEPVYREKPRSVAKPLAESQANIQTQAVAPAVAAMGGAGGLVAGPMAEIALRQQSFSAPTQQLDIQANQATEAFMQSLRGMAAGRTKNRPMSTTVYE
mgnify:CR=1 FL=1